MSVVITIQQPLKNVQYLGCEYDRMSKEEKENTILPDSVFEDQYSDQKEHNYFELTSLKSISKNCKKNRFWKKIERMQLPYHVFETDYYTSHIVVTDTIKYRQGWFLKKRFFKKACTMYMTNKRSEMISFMKKYFDFRGERAVECYKTFVEVFEDGMIFECSW